LFTKTKQVRHQDLNPEGEIFGFKSEQRNITC